MRNSSLEVTQTAQEKFYVCLPDRTERVILAVWVSF